jgi:hypothetical protein
VVANCQDAQRPRSERDLSTELQFGTAFESVGWLRGSPSAVSDEGSRRIWEDSQIATNELMEVDAPEVKFDLAGRHSVFAPFACGVT